MDSTGTGSTGAGGTVTAVVGSPVTDGCWSVKTLPPYGCGGAVSIGGTSVTVAASVNKLTDGSGNKVLSTGMGLIWVIRAVSVGTGTNQARRRSNLRAYQGA